jgi:hypothetical protein
MNIGAMRTTAKAVPGGIRRHPGRTLAICVPLLAVSVFTGTTVASARPEATLAVSPSALSATPAPLVENFDGGLTGPRMKTYTHPRVIPIPFNEDGCDHNYGTPNQCVPWKIPAPPGQACAWLQSNGFGPLKVYGTNRQNLPENAAGYVCASGTG